MKNIELATLIAKLENEICYYEGVEIRQGKELDSFIQKKKYFSKASLENEVTRLQEVKKDAYKKFRLNEYRNSDTYKAFESEKEKELACIREAKRARIELAVKQVLGDKWGINHFDGHSCEIGLKDPKEERVLLFGHAFTLYYGYKYCRSEFRFEANIGTMGGFDIQNQEDTQLQYYIGIGRLLSSPLFAKRLRDDLLQLCNRSREINKQLDDIDEKFLESITLEEVA